MRLRSRGPGKLLCFDLENRPLAYWYDGETTSEITAFGWKWAGAPDVWTMLLLNDGRFLLNGKKKMHQDDAYPMFVEEMARADIVYGHNIRRHDLPMLNAGLIRRQLNPLPSLLTTDTCRDIPKLGGMSKSLENLVGYYGIKGSKYTMSQPMWENANRLTDDGIALARKRVASDVLLQERLRKRLVDLGLLKPPRVWSP